MRYLDFSMAIALDIFWLADKSRLWQYLNGVNGVHYRSRLLWWSAYFPPNTKHKHWTACFRRFGMWLDARLKHNWTGVARKIAVDFHYVMISFHLYWFTTWDLVFTTFRFFSASASASASVCVRCEVGSWAPIYKHKWFGMIGDDIHNREPIARLQKTSVFQATTTKKLLLFLRFVYF